MKRMLKRVAYGVSLAIVSPAAVLYALASLASGRVSAFQFWSQALSLCPGLLGVYLRVAFFRLVLPACGRDLTLSFATILSHPGVRFGSGVYVGAFCVLGEVWIGDDVLIGSHVSILNGSRQHGTGRLDVPIRHQAGEWPRIHIGADSWIGERSVLMADVGRHCVIGAGAVVTKPVPDYAIAVGVPARVIGYRDGSAPAQVRTTSTEGAAVSDPSAAV